MYEEQKSKRKEKVIIYFCVFGKGIEKLEEYRNLIGSITKTFGECFSTPKVQENDSNKIFQNFEKLVKFV